MIRKGLRKRTEKEHVTRDVILDLLKTGLVLTAAFVAPNAVRGLRSLVSSERESPLGKYYDYSLNRTVTALWRKGLVDIKESNSGYTVTISEKGKTQVLRYDLSAMVIPKQESWDGKWRMVFFDIPTGEKQRNLFREQLKSMGFFQMQKSVYIYPYPCRKQIQFLREVYGLPHFIKFAVLETLENDEDLRRYFRL